jgi:Domain of unknown function (DU1801)
MEKADHKMRITDASVESYLAAIDDESRRNDCEALAALMMKASKHPPKMWGSTIVGFGSYHYKYDSGREGDMCLVGFSSRKKEISLYGLKDAPNHEELLAKLGKHKEGKGCVYIKGLGDVDLKVLEKLIAGAVAADRNR